MTEVHSGHQNVINLTYLQANQLAHLGHRSSVALTNPKAAYDH